MDEILRIENISKIYKDSSILFRKKDNLAPVSYTHLTLPTSDLV